MNIGFTRLSHDTMATHINKLKTNDRMLPQSYPLKSLVISPIGDKQAKKAGYVHCQGEWQWLVKTPGRLTDLDNYGLELS